MHVHAYSVRQHAIQVCIQPESFDQETIRGAPRAAATVVTGLGTGYYLDMGGRFSQASFP